MQLFLSETGHLHPQPLPTIHLQHGDVSHSGLFFEEQPHAAVVGHPLVAPEGVEPEVEDAVDEAEPEYEDFLQLTIIVPRSMIDPANKEIIDIAFFILIFLF